MSTIESRLGLLRRSGIFTTSSTNALGFLDSAEHILTAESADDESSVSVGVVAAQQQQKVDHVGGEGSRGRISLATVNEAVVTTAAARATTDDTQQLQAKYRSLKHQYAILDAASRASVTDREKIVSENKRLKFQIAKIEQARKLHEMEVSRLQSQMVAVQETMTEFAAQAKRDREEAVAEARREATKRNKPSEEAEKE